MNALSIDEVAGAAMAEADAEQFLTFMLAGEVYAIGILRVKEIIEFGRLTEVPAMPDFIRGVINLRGAVVPVVDLAARFGKPATQVGRRTCIVIVEVDNGDDKEVIGVMVDAVNEVLDIPLSEIEAAPSFGTRIRPDFICGMGKVAGRFVILLDMNKVLSLDEIADIAAAL
jgi:purine-binding chemotaxis protein CheW